MVTRRIRISVTLEMNREVEIKDQHRSLSICDISYLFDLRLITECTYLIIL